MLFRSGEGRLETLADRYGYRVGDGTPGPAVLREAGLLA